MLFHFFNTNFIEVNNNVIIVVISFLETLSSKDSTFDTTAFII